MLDCLTGYITPSLLKTRNSVNEIRKKIYTQNYGFQQIKKLYNRGNLKKKTEIEFLVSWLGYAQEHNSWEPYKALRDSEQLHAYLTEHKLRFLIPQKFLK